MRYGKGMGQQTEIMRSLLFFFANMASIDPIFAADL